MRPLQAAAAIVLLAAGAAFAQAPPIREPSDPVRDPAPTPPGVPPAPDAQPGVPQPPMPLPALRFPQTPVGPAPQLPTTPVAPPDTRPFSLKGSVRLEGEYNDNFFLARDHARSEYRETLTPSVSLRLFRGRDDATFTYTPSLVHSSLTPDDILLFHLFDANGTLGITERLTLRASEHFLRTDEPTLADPLSLRRDRRVVTTNTFGASLTYERDTWSLSPRYALTLVDYGAEEDATGTTGGAAATSETERSAIHVMGADATLQALPRTLVGAAYEYTVGTFRVANDFTGHLGRATYARELGPQTTALASASLAHREPEGGDAFNIYRADAGLRRQLRPQYLVEVRAGYFGTDAVSGSDASGLEYTLRAAYTGRWMSVTATSGRSLVETFGETVNAGVVRQQRTALEIRLEPAPPLTVSLRAAHTESAYLQAASLATATGLGAGTPERRDTIVETTAEVAYKLSRVFTLHARWTRVGVESSLRTLDYVNNRFGVGLTAAFE